MAAFHCCIWPQTEHRYVRTVFIHVFLQNIVSITVIQFVDGMFVKYILLVTFSFLLRHILGRTREKDLHLHTINSQTTWGGWTFLTETLVSAVIKPAECTFPHLRVTVLFGHNRQRFTSKNIMTFQVSRLSPWNILFSSLPILTDSFPPPPPGHLYIIRLLEGQMSGCIINYNNEFNRPAIIPSLAIFTASCGSTVTATSSQEQLSYDPQEQS